MIWDTIVNYFHSKKKSPLIQHKTNLTEKKSTNLNHEEENIVVNLYECEIVTLLLRSFCKPDYFRRCFEYSEYNSVQ